MKRVAQAIMLESSAYSGLRASSTALLQSAVIVVLVSIATELSYILEQGAAGLAGLPARILLALIAWIVGTTICYIVGAKLLRTSETDATWKTVAAALGFAYAPGILRVLALLPGVRLPLVLVTMVWQFAAMVVALRTDLSFRSTWRAVAVLALGFIPYVIIVGGLYLLAG